MKKNFKKLPLNIQFFASFTGQLNVNEISSSLYNMIINQKVVGFDLSDEITKFSDEFKRDGTLYGDTILDIDVPTLGINDWLGDSEAGNLLNLDRPSNPIVSKITLDTFKQIRLTLDNYLSKRAWENEGSFALFIAENKKQIEETKRMYDGTTINTYLGTLITAATTNKITIDISSACTSGKITNNQLAVQIVGEAVRDLMDDIVEPSKDYTENGLLKSIDEEDTFFIMNKKYINALKRGLTTIFHPGSINEKLFEKGLHQKYFGTIITNTNKDTYADNTPQANKPLDKDGGYAYTPGTNNANGKVFTIKDVKLTVSGTDYELFAGDEIPAGTLLSTTAAAGTLLFGEVAFATPNLVLGVVCQKGCINYLSAFETEGEFYNNRSLTNTHFLTFGRGLGYWPSKAFIRVELKLS